MPIIGSNGPRDAAIRWRFADSLLSGYAFCIAARRASQPRLCENARDSDANGIAHHFGSASVKIGALSPHFGLFPSVKQDAITTDFLNFAFLDSLGPKQTSVYRHNVG